MNIGGGGVQLYVFLFLFCVQMDFVPFISKNK